MRVAVFSDVHGNLTALDAVLTAAHDAGADEYWCLGDAVAHGPRPAEVVGRLRELAPLTCVRGNTDRYVLTGDLGGMIPPIDDPRTATPSSTTPFGTTSITSFGTSIGSDTRRQRFSPRK
jgi:predicted phosphodiesterase